MQLHTRLIMPPNWISVLIRSEPPTACLISLDHSLRVRTIHQQNELQSLGAYSRFWEDVECKLSCVNFRRVSDPRTAFRPAFWVPGFSDDWSKSTMGAVVTSLKTPGCTGDRSGSAHTKPVTTWERHWQVWERRWQARQRRWQAWEHLWAPATSQGAPRFTLEQSW